METTQSPSKIETKYFGWIFIGTVLVTLLIQHLLPGNIGYQILYPFTLLGTWVHEMGHGITAMLLGNSFDTLEVRADAGGTAHYSGTSISGFEEATIAFAGMIAPSLTGLVMLFMLRIREGVDVYWWILGGLMVLSAFIWVPFASFGFFTVLGMGLVSFAVAVLGPRNFRWIVAQFVTVQLSMTLFRTIDYAFTEVTGAGQQSDVSAMSENLPGPYWFWGGVVSAFSIVVTVIGVYFALKPTSTSRAKA